MLGGDQKCLIRWERCSLDRAQHVDDERNFKEMKERAADRKELKEAFKEMKEERAADRKEIKEISGKLTDFQLSTMKELRDMSEKISANQLSTMKK